MQVRNKVCGGDCLAEYSSQVLPLQVHDSLDWRLETPAHLSFTLRQSDLDLDWCPQWAEAASDNA